MKLPEILPTNKDLTKTIQHKIDTKTKPLGALGDLETVALQVGLIQETNSPKINKPSLVVFAGDHGIAKENEVNAYPQEVTSQMVFNFLNGGAAINIFCKQHQVNLKVVDAGVNFDFKDIEGLTHKKVAFGTQNMRYQSAMTTQQLETAFANGAEIVQQLHKEGSNCIGFGEMGIGNTSAAALIMSEVLKLPIEKCVGAGTGLNTQQIEKKASILKEVQQKHQPDSPLGILQSFGGLEIAMITGAILQAASLRMTILIDGFIVTSALLVASQLKPEVLDYCVACHQSNEQGHRLMLEHLNLKPLLYLGLRLGEGTGAALAFPLVQSAVNFLNEMASFESAGVSEKQ